MRTVLCNWLGLKVPIIQAEIAYASCPALAAAVSGAGDLGMRQIGCCTPEAIRVQMRKMIVLTQRPSLVESILDRPSMSG